MNQWPVTRVGVDGGMGGGGDRKTPVVLPCLADYIIIRDAPTPNVRS